MVQPIPPQGVPAICFTDDPHLRADGWDVRVVERPEPTPRLRAKYFKLNPHERLPEYDASIWIDASWTVMTPDFARECLAYLDGAAWVAYPHRWHKTLAEELAAYTHPKMAGLPVKEQMQAYWDGGLPATAPVLECTSLLRRHRDPCVAEVNRAWWWENRQWSECDQLSLPFVLWKTGAPYRTFPFTLAEQPWFRLAEWRPD